MYKTLLKPTLNSSTRSQLCGLTLGLALFLLANAATADDEPFRPEAGKFPPLEKSHAYRGELVFVDHANRRAASVCRDGKVLSKRPAALRHASLRCDPVSRRSGRSARHSARDRDARRAFLPPDPKLSAVPVLPVNNKEKDAGHYRGTGTAPAENHVSSSKTSQVTACAREWSGSSRKWKSGTRQGRSSPAASRTRVETAIPRKKS